MNNLETILEDLPVSDSTKEAIKYFMETQEKAEGFISYVRKWPEDVERNLLADIIEKLIEKVWS